MSIPPLLPSPIEYGKVIGQYVMTTLDSTDPDQIPDASPVTGTITFTPLDGQGHVVDGMYVFFRTITVPLDATSGRIVTRPGQDGVWLPTGNYRAAFALAGLSLPTTDFTVTTAHTDAAPLNLALAVPPVGAVLTPTQYSELNTRLLAVEDGSSITLTRLTQAEYDALTTPDPNTLYIIAA